MIKDDELRKTETERYMHCVVQVSKHSMNECMYRMHVICISINNMA